MILRIRSVLSLIASVCCGFIAILSAYLAMYLATFGDDYGAFLATIVTFAMAWLCIRYYKCV
jgi:uncharacterized membrane protein (UPF0136 family)